MAFNFKKKSFEARDPITGMKQVNIAGDPNFWERGRIIRLQAEEFNRKNPIGSVQQRMARAIDFKQQSDLSGFEMGLQDVVRKWRGV